MNDQATTDDARIPVEDQARNDAVCDRFEAAWREGGRPELAPFLSGVAGPARTALFRELLVLDVELRRAAGANTDAAAYRARFPEFPGIINAVFARLAATSSDQGTRPSTRDGAQSNGSGTWFTESHPVAEALCAAGYAIERELGRGGMGVVYQAYHGALGRVVAVKVIRSAGFATESECRRFQNEAEAVAQLDHPHIVPVFEVGETRGLHYFSMKLIAGESLQSRLEEFSRNIRAAARMAAIVAEAVHHAHQRGILHRDLKPANILVDESGEPYVTDFGLARRMEGEGDLTHSGAIVGTPSYMSPEQASGARRSLTTATDVYSLGAVLYALLTGSAPHAGSTYVEVLDQVREVMPVAPSRLNPRVPRDLEVVCLKALEKDPTRRYASAQALAEDLWRWLSGRPIAARPVGLARRAWMWCRRHPLPAALAGLLALSVIVGLAGVAWKWREAVEQRSSFAAIDSFLARMLAESSTDVNPLGDRFTVLQMLDKAADTIGGDFQGRPQVEGAIRERIGRAYLSLGQFAKAEPQLRAAIKLDTAVLGSEHPTTLGVVNVLAAALEGSGRIAAAERLLRQNLEACRRALGPDGTTTLDAESQLGVVLAHERQLDAAEKFLRRSLAARRHVLRPGHPDTLRAVRNLCLLCVDLGRFSEAEALADEYERGIRCARGPKHPDNVSALANRGLIRRLQGRTAEAEPFYRQAVDEARRILGPEHPTTLAAAREHTRLLSELDRGGDLFPHPEPSAHPY
jgi:tetratricopeptide (TPR) repeat protein/predicted Ser/Thr protein kinase